MSEQECLPDATEVPRRRLTQQRRTQFMLSLCEVVRSVGDHVLSMGPDAIFDTVEVQRHQFSTVDAQASSKLRSSVGELMSGFAGTVLEEAEVSQAVDKGDLTFPLLIGDAVEGSTNAKRGLASVIARPILAGVSVMILESEKLASIAASAFYDFASGKTFSAVRADDGEFMSFIDGVVVISGRPDIVECGADSHRFAAVPCYSHDNTAAFAAVVQGLRGEDIWFTSGQRSSAQDLVNLMAGSIDAYVDLRSLWPGGSAGRDEVLHSWDVGGVLPVLDGLGFAIADYRGESWCAYSYTDPMALIVARPSISATILRVVQELPFINRNDDDASTTVKIPPGRLG